MSGIHYGWYSAGAANEPARDNRGNCSFHPIDDGIPPVGSLISLNKKHAIVVEVDRNQLTVFVNGKYDTLTVKPGSVKWHSDKILKSLGKVA